MRRTSALLIALVMLFSVFTFTASPAAYAAGDAAVTLTKEAEGVTLSNASFSVDGLTVRENDCYRILNWEGKDLLGESYDRVEALGGGLYVVCKQDEATWPNNYGLVKDDGTVILETNNAIIKKLDYSERFLTVIYATERVENKEDAIMYVTDKMFSFQPDDEDELYAGYERYYDLQENRFIENLGRENAKDATFDVVGDKLYDSWNDKIYDAEGKLFADFDGDENNGFFFRREGDVYKVYDAELQPVAELPERPYKIFDGGKFFVLQQKDDRYAVCDSTGKPIGKKTFRYSSLYECGNLIYGSVDENYQMVMDKTGKVLVDASDKVKYITELPLGYLSLTFNNDSKGLLYPDGSIVKKLESLSGFLSYKEAKEGVTALILNDKDFTLKLSEESYPSSVNSTAVPMLFTAKDGGRKILFSAVDGSRLLGDDKEYKSYKYAGGYLYADTGSGVDIYRVEIKG